MTTSPYNMTDDRLMEARQSAKTHQEQNNFDAAIMQRVTYHPENLSLWKRPDHYIGSDWPHYYVVCGQHRDSGLIERFHFGYILKSLNGENSPRVIVVRESHWAVGWVEWLGVHRLATEELQVADKLVAAAKKYPILDEQAFSEMEWSEACDAWNSLALRERLELLKSAGHSIFAARRYSPPWELVHDLIDL